MKPSVTRSCGCARRLLLLFGGFGSLVSVISPRRAIAFGGFGGTALLLIVFTRTRALLPANGDDGPSQFYERPFDFA